MIGLQMQEGDLLELYQLLDLYRRTYQDEVWSDVPELMEEISDRYRKLNGQDIKKATNPRGAGRKKVYNKVKAEEVKAVYNQLKNVRKTAKEAGVSTTFVYKCIRE